MRITKKKIAAVTAGAAVVALGAGSAFAFWSAGGTATGTTTLSTMASVDNASFTIAAGLAPGVTVNITGGTIHNPNAFPVQITGFGTATFASGDGTCETAYELRTGPWFSLSIPGGLLPQTLAGGATLTVPNGNGITLTMINSGDDQNACQGKSITVSVPVTATT